MLHGNGQQMWPPHGLFRQDKMDQEPKVDNFDRIFPCETITWARRLHAEPAFFVYNVVVILVVLKRPAVDGFGRLSSHTAIDHAP